MFNIKKPSFPIGLDISDKVLKAVELKKKGDKIKIGAISKYRLKSGDIVQGEIKNIPAVLAGINRLLQKTTFGNFNSNEVVACLPDPKTYIKLIKIEKTPNTLKQVIAANIEKNIPLSIKNIYYDWQTISETNTEYQVLIGVAPKSIINQYTSILNDAKLSVVALEIESISIARALLEEETKKYNGKYNKNYCLIDIGATRTSLSIYSKNSIAVSLSLPISSDRTTELIAKSLQIKTDEAEKAKIICGLDKTQAHGIVSDILSDVIDSISQKIETSVDFFKKNYPNAGEIDEILLCGGGANIKNFDKAIEEKIKINTSLKNPLSNIDEPPDAEKYFSKQHALKENNKNDTNSLELNTSSSYVTSIGLALRNVFIDKI